MTDDTTNRDRHELAVNVLRLYIKDARRWPKPEQAALATELFGMLYQFRNDIVAGSWRPPLDPVRTATALDQYHRHADATEQEWRAVVEAFELGG